MKFFQVTAMSVYLALCNFKLRNDFIIIEYIAYWKPISNFRYVGIFEFNLSFWNLIESFILRLYVVLFLSYTITINTKKSYALCINTLVNLP